MQQRGMRFMGWTFWAVWLISSAGLHAQVRDVSVTFLRAAIDTIEFNARLRLTAEFAGPVTLVQADARYLPSGTFSRFSVVDPGGELVWSHMYVQHDTAAFRTLMSAAPGTVFVFEGYKYRSERRQGAMIVTALRPGEVFLERDPPGPAPPPMVIGVGQATPPAPEPLKRTFRITVTDKASGNRTVIVNVEPGTAYDMLGSTLVIDEEALAGQIIATPASIEAEAGDLIEP